MPLFAESRLAGLGIKIMFEFIWIPLINLLIVFYHIFFNNLGVGVIFFTGFLILLLVPITNPMLLAMQKMKDFGPELEKIKQKYKGDKTKLMQAQQDFYKAKGINPASGCLPQVIQIIILIALFQGFISVFSGQEDITSRLNDILYPPLKLTAELNTAFLGRDVTKPDVYQISQVPFGIPGVFLILSAAVQFWSSKMMMGQTKKAEVIAKKTEGGMDDLMASFQKQSLYLFPLLTLFIGLKFPLVLVLYWGSLSLFQALQRYVILKNSNG